MAIVTGPVLNWPLEVKSVRMAITTDKKPITLSAKQLRSGYWSVKIKLHKVYLTRNEANSLAEWQQAKSLSRCFANKGHKPERQGKKRKETDMN